jgi:large subunit ribosomal protein L35
VRAPVGQLDKGGESRHKARPASSSAPRTALAVQGGRKERGPEAIMPKMKTNRAAKKRFKITGSGKVRRSKGGLNHCMQEKSSKRKRRLRKNDMVDSTMEKRVKLMLPYG